MKNKWIFIFLFILWKNSTFSQSVVFIDSIYNLPFATKQKEKNTLIPILLQNAKKCKEKNLNLREALCYSDLSWCYYFNGNFDENIKYSLQAIKLFEKLKHTEFLAREYGELGFRMSKRNPKKGLYYMQKGMQISEKNKHTQPLLSIYNNYGTLKKNEKQIDSALLYFNKCLQLKQQIKDKAGIPYSLNNIAEIKIQQNKFKEAKELIHQAFKLRLELNDYYGISDSYAYFGDLYQAEGKYELAIKNFNSSVAIANKYGFNNLQRHGYLMLSQCFEKLNNSTEALENYKKHIQFKDSILNKESNDKIAELEVKFETKEKERLLLEKEVEVQQSRMKLIVSFGLIGMTIVVGYFVYRQQKLKLQQQEQEFELKNAISEIETQNKLHEQRLTISRDLHDNIGAQLTFIISSVDNLKFGFPGMEQKIQNKLNAISDFTKMTIIELRDTIWAMNANEFRFDDLSARIFNFIEKAKSAKSEIQYKITIDEQVKQLKFSSLEGVNLYRTLQEAINNAIKYSECTELNVQVTRQDSILKIQIFDNGIGFDIETIDFGNGLYNMKKRIEDIGGEIQIDSLVHKGTCISIYLKTTNHD